MSNWWKKNILIIPLIFTVFKLQPPQAIAAKTNIFLNSLATSALQNRVFQPWLLAKNKTTCQQLNSQYQQVYAFETQRFYIGICQEENNYFYYRQSKLNPEKTLLLPAQIVFGGDIYQAVDGRTIYFVGMDDNGYYSSVMKNNNEIVFEPEIAQPSATLTETATPSAETANVTSSQSNSEGANKDTFSLNLDQSRDRPTQTQICTRDSTALAPELNGWQEFIGKSPKIVGEYATSNGHNFTYNQETPKQALVKTKDGLVVNLDIATFSQTVRRVCVDPIVSTDPQY
ncbi:MAG: hypothetical protein ACFCU5_01860 [Pleurocapsa sp.]